MGRFNCFKRKAAVVRLEPSIEPARPAFDIPLRRNHNPEKSDVKENIVQVNQVQVETAQPAQPPPLDPQPNEMYNAQQRANGSSAPPLPQQFIDLISDDEDEDELINHAGPRDAVGARQNPVLHNDDGQPQPGLPAQAPADPALAAIVIDDDLDVNDPVLAQLMMEGFQREQHKAAARSIQPASQPSSDQSNQQAPPQASNSNPKIHCIDQLLLVFPDICRDYVSELYATISQSSDVLIAHILDKTDRGTQYTRAKDTQNNLKRKRVLDEDEEAAKKYGSADRVFEAGPAGFRPYIRTLLSKDFPETPMAFLDVAMRQSGYRLFSTYRVLEEAHRTFDPAQPPYNKIKQSRRMEDEYKDENLEVLIEHMTRNRQIQEAEILRELQAARRIRKKAEAKQQADLVAEVEETRNLRKAEAEGTISECGCCFGDFPMNRMVHCDGDTLHFFCRACAKQNADTEIGNSKYELRCMSMDGCDSGFSLSQRNQFLDETTIIALERNEQEAVLRMAGIENLASCPFCPYAAEYPPVDIDREFRCQAPECEKISCRLCKLESHIPKSCEEHAKDQGLSVRRQIEEAMSAALIRKCNKCGTPFVKEEGCNKMTCTRGGCMNVQCYVCSKSCSYDHFNDARRGGKAGNCPLFESVEDRHDTEVRKAEREALDKIRAEHPEFTEEDLKIKVSEDVKKDDERRKANDPRNVMFAPAAYNRARILPHRYEIPEDYFLIGNAAPGAVVDGPRIEGAADHAHVNLNDGIDNLWDDFPRLGRPGHVAPEARRMARPIRPDQRHLDPAPVPVPRMALQGAKVAPVMPHEAQPHPAMRPGLGLGRLRNVDLLALRNNAMHVAAQQNEGLDARRHRPGPMEINLDNAMLAAGGRANGDAIAYQVQRLEQLQNELQAVRQRALQAAQDAARGIDNLRAAIPRAREPNNAPPSVRGPALARANVQAGREVGQRLEEVDGLLQRRYIGRPGRRAGAAGAINPPNP